MKVIRTLENVFFFRIRQAFRKLRLLAICAEQA